MADHYKSYSFEVEIEKARDFDICRKALDIVDEVLWSRFENHIKDLPGLKKKLEKEGLSPFMEDPDVQIKTDVSDLYSEINDLANQIVLKRLKCLSKVDFEIVEWEYQVKGEKGLTTHFEVADGGKLLFFGDEGVPEIMLQAVQTLVDRFDLMPVNIEYATHCSKPRTNAFGGGVIRIEKDKPFSGMSTSSWIREQNKEYQIKLENLDKGSPGFAP